MFSKYMRMGNFSEEKSTILINLFIVFIYSFFNISKLNYVRPKSLYCLRPESPNIYFGDSDYEWTSAVISVINI